MGIILSRNMRFTVLALLQSSTWAKEDVVCCQAVEASCEACKAGLTVDEYCKSNKDMQGCGANTDEPKMCCEALTASCMSCSKGVTVEEFCKDNKEVVGCDDGNDDSVTTQEEKDD